MDAKGSFFDAGRRHDFLLFKNSQLPIRPSVEVVTGAEYLGIRKLHGNSRHPKKQCKKHTLTREDRRFNRDVSRERILNEHVIGALKRFRILSERYRNRGKKFALRFNLIAGIYNYDLKE